MLPRRFGHCPEVRLPNKERSRKARKVQPVCFFEERLLDRFTSLVLFLLASDKSCDKPMKDQPSPLSTLQKPQSNQPVQRVLGSKKRPYVGINSCPSSKKVAFGVDYVYTDGSKKSTTTTAKCS